MNIINALIASGQIYQGVQYNGLHIVGYNDGGMAFYRFNENRDWIDYRLQTLRASPTAKLMCMGYMNVYERFSREKDYNEELMGVRKTEIEISYE